MTDITRRAFCAAALGAASAMAVGPTPAYEDMGLVVHQALPARTSPYRCGEIVFDLRCSRWFRIVRMRETELGLIAKTRWVRPIA